MRVEGDLCSRVMCSGNINKSTLRVLKYPRLRVRVWVIVATVTDHNVGNFTVLQCAA